MNVDRSLLLTGENRRREESRIFFTLGTIRLICWSTDWSAEWLNVSFEVNNTHKRTPYTVSVSHFRPVSSCLVLSCLREMSSFTVVCRGGTSLRTERRRSLLRLKELREGRRSLDMSYHFLIHYRQTLPPTTCSFSFMSVTLNFSSLSGEPQLI